MAEYRIAQKADIPQLSLMRYEFWEEDGSDPAELEKESFISMCDEFLDKSLSSGQWTCWIALVDDAIISHIYIQLINKIPKPSKTKDSFGYVTNFYTKPDFRGQGLGRELLKHTKVWAEEQDLEFLISWPSDESKDLYNQEGFNQTSAVECVIRDYVN